MCVIGLIQNLKFITVAFKFLKIFSRYASLLSVLFAILPVGLLPQVHIWRRYDALIWKVHLVHRLKMGSTESLVLEVQKYNTKSLVQKG